MIDNFLNECLDIFKCDRVLIAKIHPLILNDVNNLVFSTIFEKNKPPSAPIANYVKNISVNVLDLEFEQELDRIVIANKDVSIYPEKCIAHLDKLKMNTIVNQLLYTNSYLWGIFSIQYSKNPYWLNSKIDTEIFKYLAKQNKNKIINSILL